MKWLAAALLATGGCMAAGEEMVPEGMAACDAGAAQALVGQPATAALGARALELTGARALRWIRPGDVVTMDYRTDRLNIVLDASGRVSGLKCG